MDTEKVREFFPLDHVVATTLEIYQELLSLRFEEVPKGRFQTWHQEVHLFAVYDQVCKNFKMNKKSNQSTG